MGFTSRPTESSQGFGAFGYQRGLGIVVRVWSFKVVGLRVFREFRGFKGFGLQSLGFKAQGYDGS